MFIQNINYVLQYTLLFKSLGSDFFFFSAFIQQGCVKWIKVVVKLILLIINKMFIFLFNAVLFNFLFA